MTYTLGVRCVYGRCVYVGGGRGVCEWERVYVHTGSQRSFWQLKVRCQSRSVPQHHQQQSTWRTEDNLRTRSSHPLTTSRQPPIALLSIYANLTYRRQKLLCFSRNFRQFLNIWKMSNWLPEHPRSQFCRWCWKVVQGCVGHPVHSADLLSPLC